MLLATLLFAACSVALDYTALKGNKSNGLPDFSYAGYRSGVSRLPLSAPNVTLPVGSSQDKIQAALNTTSQNGGGVVLLAAGTYKLKGGLVIPNGTVLRGAGSDKTILLTGSQSSYDPAFITLGENKTTNEIIKSTLNITNNYYPVGSRTFNVSSNTTGLTVGQDVYIQRKASQAWIDDNGMNSTFLSKPNDTNVWIKPDTWIRQPRKIASVDRNSVTIDIPITDQLDPYYMNSSIAVYDFPKASAEVGLESLGVRVFPSCSGQSIDLISCNGSAVVTVNEYTQDSWIRNVNITGANNAVTSEKGSRRLTFDNVIVTRDNKTLNVSAALAADFSINSCQTLIANCAVLFPPGLNTKSYPVVTGSLIPGPNVVTNFTNLQPDSRIEPHQRWAHGLLVEKSNSTVRMQNRGDGGSGQGWSMNSGVSWNNVISKGGSIKIDSPPLGNNWDIGSPPNDDSSTLNRVDGTVTPDSLFNAQRKARNLPAW